MPKTSPEAMSSCPEKSRPGKTTMIILGKGGRKRTLARVARPAGKALSQNNHKDLMETQGLPDRPARKEVSQVLGHNRVDGVASYIPVGSLVLFPEIFRKLSGKLSAILRQYSGKLSAIGL